MGSRAIDFGGRVISAGNNDEGTVYSGRISNGGLRKVGAGTLTLSGDDPYTGVASVDLAGGTLELSSFNQDLGTLL